MKLKEAIYGEINAARVRDEYINSIIMTRRAEMRLKRETDFPAGIDGTLCYFAKLPVVVLDTKEEADKMIAFAIDCGGHFIYVRE